MLNCINLTRFAITVDTVVLNWSTDHRVIARPYSIVNIEPIQVTSVEMSFVILGSYGNVMWDFLEPNHTGYGVDVESPSIF